MGSGRMLLAFVVAATWCVTNPTMTSADADGDELPAYSAERLGDADAPEPASDEDEHYLSPAEREALAAQGSELEIDDTIVTQTRIQPPKTEKDDEPKGRWGRAMESMGKATVAVASVAIPLAAAVAPFLLF